MNFLFKPTSYATGTAQAVVATFVWKFVSFLNALLLAAYFGATYKTDIYFYVIMVIGLPIYFVQRLNQTILIPEAMFLNEKNPQDARKFLTMWLYLYGIIGLVCAIGGSIFTVNSWKLFSHFSTQELSSQQTVLILGVWWFGLQLVSYHLQMIAEMFKFFSTAWLNVLNALFPLVCLLCFGKQTGIASMLYGFVTANIIQIILLLHLCKKQAGFSWVPAFYPVSKRIYQNIAAGQGLAALDIVNGLLPIYLMSGLNAGVITALNYCRQLTDSTAEVFTARTANITKIALTETATRRQHTRFNEQLLLSTRLLVIILAPLAVFSCYFAPQIVKLFFERGAFTQEAARQTVLFLQPMLFSMLLWAPGFLQNSAIAAARRIKESFPYTFATGLILTGLLWFAIPHYGAFSYPYILLIGLVIGFILNALFFRKYLPFIAYGKQLWLTLRITFFAVLTLLPAVWVSRQLPALYWLQILVCGTVFVSIYAGICWLTKEIQPLKEFRHHF